MNQFKLFLKDWLPPVVMRTVRRLKNNVIRFEGDFKSWSEAATLCSGYEAQSILDKVLQATLKVKNGEAVFERDSVIFDEVQYSWPVTAALMWSAVRNNQKLHVLDFGGSLGSSYFQNRKFLNGMKELSWFIVEQKKIAQVGNEMVADDILRFFSDIHECCDLKTPNVILISGVLQYLDDPYALLSLITQKGADLIIIDRTPFANNLICRIKIQHVPAEIYPASYPCWFFDRNNFLGKMDSFGYKLIESFDSLDRLSEEAKWQGMIFMKVDES